ncbi:hypothetical protein GA0070612_3665 [Micromonospora chokoriensis]|uniref:Uncharacterized protein n=1 Tax=Micromonospora chokoriensis TaxID=356851 RepID=A0A1C4XJA4_9ACTN|nr:hypothetical protein GA0070612_3665 [Micromonospora chokoriensis]
MRGTESALDAAARRWSIAAGKEWNTDEQHYRNQPLSAVPTAQTTRWRYGVDPEVSYGPGVSRSSPPPEARWACSWWAGSR